MDEGKVISVLVENIDEGSYANWTCDSDRIKVNAVDYGEVGLMEYDQMIWQILGYGSCRDESRR